MRQSLVWLDCKLWQGWSMPKSWRWGCKMTQLWITFNFEIQLKCPKLFVQTIISFCLNFEMHCLRQLISFFTIYGAADTAKESTTSMGSVLNDFWDISFSLHTFSREVSYFLSLLASEPLKVRSWCMQKDYLSLKRGIKQSIRGRLVSSVPTYLKHLTYSVWRVSTMGKSYSNVNMD